MQRLPYIHAYYASSTLCKFSCLILTTGPCCAIPGIVPYGSYAQSPYHIDIVRIIMQRRGLVSENC